MKNQKRLITLRIRIRMSEREENRINDTQVSPRIVFNKDYGINKLELVPTATSVHDFNLQRKQIF
jgi:hypothetical protein